MQLCRADERISDRAAAAAAVSFAALLAPNARIYVYVRVSRNFAAERPAAGQTELIYYECEVREC